MEKYGIKELNGLHNVALGIDEMLVTTAPSLPMLIAIENDIVTNRDAVKNDLLEILNIYTLSNLFTLSLTDPDNVNMEVDI